MSLLNHQLQIFNYELRITNGKALMIVIKLLTIRELQYVYDYQVNEMIIRYL